MYKSILQDSFDNLYNLHILLKIDKFIENINFTYINQYNSTLYIINTMYNIISIK